MDSGQNRLYTTFPNIFSLLSADPADLSYMQKNHFSKKNPWFFGKMIFLASDYIENSSAPPWGSSTDFSFCWMLLHFQLWIGMVTDCSGKIMKLKYSYQTHAHITIFQNQKLFWKQNFVFTSNKFFSRVPTAILLEFDVGKKSILANLRFCTTHLFSPLQPSLIHEKNTKSFVNKMHAS